MLSCTPGLWTMKPKSLQCFQRKNGHVKRMPSGLIPELKSERIQPVSVLGAVA